MAVEHGVDGGYAFLQGGYFGFDAYFGGGESGYPHFHADVAFAAASFGQVYHGDYFAYGGFAEIGQVEFVQDVLYYIMIDGGVFVLAHLVESWCLGCLV